MLVLSRKLNEEILISGGIRLKVIEVTQSRVKLGICAPDEVPIRREELLASRSWHDTSAIMDDTHNDMKNGAYRHQTSPR